MFPDPFLQAQCADFYGYSYYIFYLVAARISTHFLKGSGKMQKIYILLYSDRWVL